MLAGLALILMLSSASCGSKGIAELPSFDSVRAYGFLETQVAFGPRVPGSDAHKEAAKWLEARLQEHSDRVSVQSFSTEYNGSQVEMFNLIASFYPDKPERVLLCAHWDSRYKADQDPDRANQQKAVPGANDGASGVAVLLELARIISESEPQTGIDIAFFDGEDGGDEGEADRWLLGSRHFAKTMPPGYRPKHAILLDMIGDSDLGLSSDVNSKFSAFTLWNKVVENCKKLDIPVSEQEISIYDDHIPLIERGIPAIDLIDFDYPYWHTIEDTPDKCSAESLGKIGKLVLSLIYGD